MFWEIFKKIRENMQSQEVTELGKVVLQESIFPKGILTPIEEAKIKLKGEIWYINKTGEHDFPSDPHAHNRETGTTMDLRTGELYRKRDCIGVVGKKEFLHFRELIQQQNISIPPIQRD
jgi:hypothetical protein